MWNLPPYLQEHIQLKTKSSVEKTAKKIQSLIKNNFPEDFQSISVYLPYFVKQPNFLWNRISAFAPFDILREQWPKVQDSNDYINNKLLDHIISIDFRSMPGFHSTGYKGISVFFTGMNEYYDDEVFGEYPSLEFPTRYRIIPWEEVPSEESFKPPQLPNWLADKDENEAERDTTLFFDFIKVDVPIQFFSVFADEDEDLEDEFLELLMPDETFFGGAPIIDPEFYEDEIDIADFIKTFVGQFTEMFVPGCPELIIFIALSGLLIESF